MRIPTKVIQDASRGSKQIESLLSSATSRTGMGGASVLFFIEKIGVQGAAIWQAFQERQRQVREEKHREISFFDFMLLVIADHEADGCLPLECQLSPSAKEIFMSRIGNELGLNTIDDMETLLHIHFSEGENYFAVLKEICGNCEIKTCPKYAEARA